MSTVNHDQIVHDASAALEQAWREQHPGQALSYNARTMLLAVAWSESNFGRFGTMASTNNWGAIQCTESFKKEYAGQSGYECFQHADHDYNGKPLRPWFRGYPNQLEAARDFLRFIWRGDVPAAAESGDPLAMAKAMWGLRYYTGTTGTPEERQQAYAHLIGGGLAFVRGALARPRQAERPELAGLRVSPRSVSSGAVAVGLLAVAALGVGIWAARRG